MAKVVPVIRTESREQADAKVMLEHLERECNVNKIYLFYLGVWPCQSTLAKYFISICCFVLMISFYPYEILLLYDSWEDSLLIRFDVFYLLIATSLLAGKIFNGIWNHKKMECICIAVNDHWNIFTSKSEVQTLKNYSNISRKLTIVYSAFVYFATLIFITTPLVPIFFDIIYPLNESRPQLLPMREKFGNLGENYYTPLYCYHVSSIVLSMINSIANDTTYFVCIIQTCSLFSIISQQFEELITQLYVNKNVKKFGCYMDTKLQFENKLIIYQEYITCLRKYQLALEFVDMLNSTYKIISLTFLILNGAIVTLAGVQIIYVLDRLQDVTKYNLVLTATLGQLFIFCCSGQKLKDETQNIFYQAYIAKWYKCSSRLKTLLIITLYRSIPYSLIADNIVSLSMMTFNLVIQTAESYFMTFLSFKK